MAPQITDIQQITKTDQVEELKLPAIKKDEGYGAKVIRKGSERWLRLLANFAELETDIILRPVEDRLYIHDDADNVLRVYDLPESVDPFTVEAALRPDGLLIVTSQLKSVEDPTLS